MNELQYKKEITRKSDIIDVYSSIGEVQTLGNYEKSVCGWSYNVGNGIKVYMSGFNGGYVETSNGDFNNEDLAKLLGKNLRNILDNLPK